MDYLYVLPDHPMRKSESEFKYLSVKKISFPVKAGEKVFLLYRKSKKTVPGIIGFCLIAGNPKRVRRIPKEKRHLCFNRSYWQLPVKEIQCGLRNIIDEEVLYSLPSLNEGAKIRTFKECSMVRTYSLEHSIDKHSKYWYIWRAERSQKEIKEYHQLYVHELREEYATFHKIYFRLSRGINQCAHCGVYHEEYLPYTPPFFEFHEDNIPPIDGKYHRIDYSKFIALCSNCHKKVHEQMVQQSFNDKKYGYQGFDDGGLSCGWNVDHYSKQID